MSVYRVNKKRSGYTLMANYHLRDKRLTLKAVGLLSKMLSFNDGWKFSTNGLAAICKEGPDAIRSALNELEDNGYLVRQRQRDSKGRISNTVFDIYEEPHSTFPDKDNPHQENPYVDNPDMEKPHTEKSAQINTNKVIPEERNTDSINYQSINLDEDGMDVMFERNSYEAFIRENLELDILSQDNRFDTARANEIVEIMLDAICSTSPTLRVNNSDVPKEVVKSRLLKLNSSHLEYVFDALNNSPSDVRNIRAYMLTVLYNAPTTIDTYYSAKVNHDLCGGRRRNAVREYNYDDYDPNECL